MKRIIVMLLIACSAVTTVSAQQKGKQDNVPYNVKALFYSIITTWGDPNEVYSVNKNPETNQIESSVRITTFSADNDKFPHMAGKVYLNTSVISDAFKKDEPKSYQILHITSGDFKRFSLKAVNEDGQSETYQIRNNNDEEMWLMCCKNPDNPKLRDAYAIKWVITKEGTKINGMVYQITSLRPDKYEKPLDYSKRMFKIEGRVGDEIKDSLYNIYIAESREALYNLEDHEYVACIPVVNKRFEWQTELTKPCVGRLRCIFPDGELCSAWIDLDFVPGETYHITVHNGYYDEDKDYERRVGRQSGHSLIEPNAVKVVDSQSFKPTEIQRMQLEPIMELAMMKIEEIQSLYKSLDSKNVSWLNKGAIFDNITKKNKELDKQFQDVIKVVKDIKMPKNEESKALSELYKEILRFYTEQNKALTEISGQGQLPKSAQKTQETVNKIIQKYMNEMSKTLLQ